MESIVFHAKKKADDKVPSFTVRFGMEHDFGEKPTLLCTVSKPHPYLESYCKETGRNLTNARLSKLVQEAASEETDIRAYHKVETLADLRRFLPNGTASVLHYYAEKAKRYFKVEDPRIIIRGTQIKWSRAERGTKAEKSFKILITSIGEITPPPPKKRVER